MMISIIHKELERKVKNLRHIKLEVMNPKIKNKYEPAHEYTMPGGSTGSVTVVID